MIQSLVVTGRYALNVSKGNKLKIEGELQSVNEIPVIRYRFNEYKEEDIEYILENNKKFKNTLVVVEVEVGKNKSIDEMMDEMDLVFQEKMDEVAKFLYVEVGEEEVANGLGEEVLEVLGMCNTYEYDRVSLRDRSKTLYALSALSIKRQVVKELGCKLNDIGICNSPLSNRLESCLGAEKARELAAKYDRDIKALPTAKHQCMECCGCIRYLKIEKDTEEILDGVVIKKDRADDVKVEKKDEGTERVKKVKKKANKKSIYSW